MTAAKARMALILSLLIGGIGTAVSQGAVPDGWMPIAESATVLLTAVGTAFGVYQTSNQKRGR